MLANKKINLTIDRLCKRANDTRDDFRDTGGSGGMHNALYGVQLEGSGAIRDFTYGCHNYLRHIQPTEPHSVYSVWRNPGREYESAAENWFGWITGPESPWRSLWDLQPGIETAEFGNTNSIDFQRKYGFVFDNLKTIPANFMWNFLVASRLPIEWPKYVQRWDLMVTDHGIHPAFALFYLTFFSDVSQTSQDASSALCKYRSEDRNALCAQLNKYDWPLDTQTCNEEYLRNFIAGKPVFFTKPYYEYTASTPINRLWGTISNLEVTDPQTYRKQVFERYKATIGSLNGRSSNFGYEGQDGETLKWRLNWDEIVQLIHLEQDRILGELG